MQPDIATQQAELEQIEAQIARVREALRVAEAVQATDLAVVDFHELVQSRAVTREGIQMCNLLADRASTLRMAIARRIEVEEQRAADEARRTQRLAAIDAELADLQVKRVAWVEDPSLREPGVFVTDLVERQWQLQHERARLV